MSFWINKPLGINDISNISYILDSNTLLSQINTEISNSKLSLDYHIITSPDRSLKSQILKFINNNYNSINSNLSLEYSKELFDYYITSDTLCILFYPRNKKPTDISAQNMIGFICGRPEIIYIKQKNDFQQYKTIDVNYLCLIKPLRKLHVSSYIINILTKECILKSNKQVICAVYTIGKIVNAQSFSNKSFYHRPINIEKLINSNLLNLDKYPQALKIVFEKFDWNKDFLKDYKFIHLTKDYLDTNYKNLENIVNQIHDKLLFINKNNYDIFDYKSKDDIKKLLLNKSFYNFLIINKHNDEIEDFICLYNLITKNIVNNNYSRNGYFYIFMTSKNDTFKYNIIEYISEYSFTNNLFDMIILMNVMENGFDDNIHYKILNTSSKLYYYMYNLKLPQIHPSKNGLVTI